VRSTSSEARTPQPITRVEPIICPVSPAVAATIPVDRESENALRAHLLFKV